MRTLNGIAQVSPFTYAHVDLEDSAAAPCTEADGSALVQNEYGASGFNPVLGHERRACGAPLHTPAPIS